jgi:translation initiation factor 5
MINIAGLTPVDDPSYRYKMPRILPKVEGRGNGIKTVLVNIVDIGTALNRDAPEITKFFGFELGAQTTFSVEEDSRAVVNGSHSSQDLQQLLTKYIEMFVLCKNCKLPETHYKIKGGIINQKCLACGSKESCDMTHKLTTFILKQHQKAKADDPDKEKKKEKKEKKEKSESSNGAGEEVKEKKPKKDKEKSAEKEKKPKKDKKKDEDHVNEDGVEEEDEEETDSDAIGR